MKNKLIIILIMLIIVLIGIFIYVNNRNNSKNFDKQELISMDDEIKVTSLPTKQATVSPTPVQDEYAGWKTYTNNEIGYNLKYPNDWIVDEFTGYSELIGQDVKYITINTPDGKYFLHVGIKKPDQTFAVSDRTGIGAGDMKENSSYMATIFSTKFTPIALSFEEKVKEFFWDNPEINSDKCNCVFSITFSYTEEANYNEFDMTNLSYTNDVLKILKTISWN